MAYTYKDAYEDLETQLKQMGVKRSYNFNTPQMQEKLANGEAPFNEFASDRDKQMWNAYVKAYGGADSSYLPLSDGSYGAGISGPSGTTGKQSGTTTAGPGTGTTGTPASAIGDGTTGNMTLLSDTSGGGEHVLYWDNETQSTRDGWVIDGTLYSDEPGTQMAAPGSHYAGGDGQYYVMEDGTMMYGPDYQRMLAEQAHQQRVENGFAIIDRQGNIVGHVSYDELLMAQNNEQGGGSSGGGAGGFGGYGVGYGNPGAGGDATAEAYIRQIYDQQIAANQAALENAYELNVNTINAQKQLLPVTYGTARNATAAQAEIQRGNFNEYASAAGLSSGAGGQARLSMSNALQGNLSALDKAQANALASLDLQLTNLTTQYRNDLAKAFAEGNLAKVATLYENYESNKAALLSQAQFEAQLQLSRDQLAQQQSQFDASLAEQIRQFDETMTFNQDKYAASQTSGSGTRLVTSPEPIITDDPKYVFTGVRSTTDPGVVDDVYQEALYRRGFKGANDVELIDFLASMVVAGRILYEEAQAIMKRLGIAG